MFEAMKFGNSLPGIPLPVSYRLIVYSRYVVRTPQASLCHALEHRLVASPGPGMYKAFARFPDSILPHVPRWVKCGAGAPSHIAIPLARRFEHAARPTATVHLSVAQQAQAS
jgi:hypothetical protein